jgi:hypothetical protein
MLLISWWMRIITVTIAILDPPVAAVNNMVHPVPSGDFCPSVLGGRFRPVLRQRISISFPLNRPLIACWNRVNVFFVAHKIPLVKNS